MNSIQFKYMRNVFCAATVMVCLAITGCKREEWLNPLPSTLITDVTAFGTPERIANQVNGLYNRLKANGFWGSWYLVASDIRTGEFQNINFNAATGAIVYQMLTQTTTGDVENIWLNGYQAINACNVFMDGINTYGLEVLEPAQAQSYIAEARVIRALVYYSLLQLYARPYWDGQGSMPGLPLRLTGNMSPQNYDLARSSVAETYDQILADLNFAEENLPLQYGSAFLNTTRAHRNTAIALKTRVYLSMQRYSSVIAEANKLVAGTASFTAPEGVPHALEADIGQVFLPPYTTNESILSMPFTSNDAPGQSLARYYLPGIADGGTPASNGAGEYALYPEGIVGSEDWPANDARRQFVLLGSTSGRYWLTKFGTAAPYTDYAPVIRYAEVLLNLAEAITRDDQQVDERALALLNAVRQRSDASTAYSPATFSDWNALADAILQERRIEFLGEGIRNADLMRLGLPIPAKAVHAVQEVGPSAPNYIFPISGDELILNRLMTNN